MSALATITKIAKGLFTAARIADAGLSIYMIGDAVYSEIDPEGRYPELRDLTNKALNEGKSTTRCWRASSRGRLT
ncbi:MAG: hypothetical protein HC902_14155 [Calothrix sp. SM1_5_4]|nr:hypothetical protein [Calothrix sp. SM1_5_4]